MNTEGNLGIVYLEFVYKEDQNVVLGQFLSGLRTYSKH